MTDRPSPPPPTSAPPTPAAPTDSAGPDGRPRTGPDQPNRATRTAPDAARPTLGLFRLDRAQRRRERMIEEIQRNRRGEYTVPTWVLALVLLVVVGGWAALIIFS